MDNSTTIDIVDHKGYNILILAASAFGTVISHITMSGVAAGLTIILALLGIINYLMGFKLKRMDKKLKEQEKEKLELQIKKLKNDA